MKVLVPVDGSPASTRAVKYAIDFAKSRGRPALVLANVQNIVTLGLGEAGAMMPADWQEKVATSLSRQQLRKAIAICKQAKVPFESVAESGAVGETIVRIARRKKAEHIVMGTRGLGGVRGLLLGSTTTAVVHLATVPVTLIK